MAVVPTRSPVQGLAAIAVADPARRFGDDVIAMAEAAAATRWAEVTVAEQEALTSAGRCRPATCWAPPRATSSSSAATSPPWPATCSTGCCRPAASWPRWSSGPDAALGDAVCAHLSAVAPDDRGHPLRRRPRRHPAAGRGGVTSGGDVVAVTLETPLARVLGPKTAKGMAEQLGLHTVRDLLRHYPRRYARAGRAGRPRRRPGRRPGHRPGPGPERDHPPDAQAARAPSPRSSSATAAAG